jgi:release factor glutamine methyltransferase
VNLRPLIARLEAAGVADPAGDARRIFDWAYARGAEAGPQDRDAPNAVTLAHLERAVTEREARRPVSQIIGRRSFWRHDFDVTGDVLDPRPDTETLVEQALAMPFSRVLDLGTGTGCIVISLLAEYPKARGVAVDLSKAALRVAAANARRIGVADRLELLRSDWFDAVTGDFDLIVSNPPYIAEAEMADLAPEVRQWEPRMALTDEADGLTAYRIIATCAGAHLRPGGRLMVEIGPGQGAAVHDLFEMAGFEGVAVIPDLDGRDRVVWGRMPG